MVSSASGRRHGSPSASSTSTRADAARWGGNSGWATTAIPPWACTAAIASASDRPAGTRAVRWIQRTRLDLFTEQQLRALLAAAAPAAAYALTVLFGTGLRASEAAALDRDPIEAFPCAWKETDRNAVTAPV